MDKKAKIEAARAEAYRRKKANDGKPHDEIDADVENEYGLSAGLLEMLRKTKPMKPPVTHPAKSLPTAAGMVDALVDRDGCDSYEKHCEDVARDTGWKPADIKRYHKTGDWR